MGWEWGGGVRREGMYVYLWLILADVWQRPAQYCKAIILQLKAKGGGQFEASEREKNEKKTKNRTQVFI